MRARLLKIGVSWGARGLGLAMALALALAVFALGLAGAVSAHGSKPKTCRGSLKSPGVLSGTYPAGVVIKGTCKVSAGTATVKGTLTIGGHAVLLAAYGLNDRTGAGTSRLVVDGNVVMKAGSTLILGCEYSHLNCLDEPRSGSPELTSSSEITGSLTASKPLAIVIHSSTVKGPVQQSGGGGGLKCPTTGVWKELGFPVYSDYEDSRFSHSITITGMRSCWLGFARDRIARNLTVTRNSMSDPDAIEILSNVINGNLRCSHDSHVWDNHDVSTTLWPRKASPNTVHGKRYGQCRLASPSHQGGSSGPGPF